jgi:glycosyltransferase involved in cell wall biosynthesis
MAGGLRLLRRGRHENTVIVCHTGMDAVTAGLAHRLVARSTRLVVVDFLLPMTTPRWLLRWALRGVDDFVVIRSGDTRILARLGVPTDRCRFVAFAAPTKLAQRSTGMGEYVYSGGAAQRDWSTLADALGQSGIPALVSCPEEDQRFTSNVLKVPLVRPDQGRKFLSGSRFLVQAVIDNDQPSGPLLILDAFSAGKPVVATDVNGTRDYVEDDVNGVLVPPHDPVALANAISALYSDVDRVARMAEAARRTASALSSPRFWREVLGPYVDADESQKDTVPD